MTPQVADRNTGHGHVWPRPDGVKARCGGPNICAQCAIDYARYHDKPAPDPETFAMTPPAEKVAEPFKDDPSQSWRERFTKMPRDEFIKRLRYFAKMNPGYIGTSEAALFAADLLAAAPTPSVAQSEREAFEAIFGNPNGITASQIAGLRSGDEYMDDELQSLYGGWCAALTWQARASAGSARVDARAAAEETEMNRILALSNEEVIAETIAAGEDPQEVATRGRAILEAAIVANRERVAAAHAHAISQSNSAFQQVLMRVAFTAGAEWQRTYQFAHTHSAPPALTPVLSVAEDTVIEERRRQVLQEGWTTGHDDEHDGGEMAIAAACYAMRADRVGGGSDVPKEWPWDKKWWKPKSQRYDLVRAAALLIAEIERLDRLIS